MKEPVDTRYLSGNVKLEIPMKIRTNLIGREICTASQAKCQPKRRTAALLLFAMIAIPAALLAQNANPGVAPPNSNPHGTSYGRWGAAWVQWVYSLHANVPLNPIRSSGAVDCGYGQSGNVWFLAGTIVPGQTTRSCSVPVGTWLFLPVLNSWGDNVGTFPPATMEELRSGVAWLSEPSELHASIDGVTVQNIAAYRAAYGPFSYTVPDIDNMLQYQGYVVPGKDWPQNPIYPAFTDGVWLMLNPLPPGPHTLNFGGTAKNTGFQLDITYNITVVPKGKL